MKRRALYWVIGLFALMVLIPVVAFNIENSRNEAAFQDQLALARKEGLATSAAEFASIIRPAKPEENAAPLYRDLKGKFASNDDTFGITNRLAFNLEPAAETEAAALLKKRRETIEILDRAVQLPHCWFDRDWSLGAALLLPEYADMRQGSRLLVLRGSLAARRGDAQAAIDDAKKSIRVARHLEEECFLLGRLVAQGIEYGALQALSTWAFNDPAEKRYRDALLEIIEAMPKPDVRMEYRGKLLETMSLIELCATKEGRRKLGLRPEDVSQGEKILPKVFNPAQSRVDLVKAHRDHYAALLLPPNERPPKLQVAQQNIYKAMLAFPMAAKMIENLTEDENILRVAHREYFWEARKQQYVAFCRALEGGKIAREIDTQDLLSPFDKKPISYSFDGTQIQIRVSGMDRALKMPSDRALGRSR